MCVVVVTSTRPAERSRLGGERAQKRGLAARAHRRHHVAPADPERDQQAAHGPVYSITNRPPLMSLATIRFEPGKM